MKNVKYKDYRIGEHIFTVRFQRRYDLGEPAIDVEIWEQHTPRTGFIYRLIEPYKYQLYWGGTWLARDVEALEDYAIRICEGVINAMEEKNKAEKFWNDLDK